MIETVDVKTIYEAPISFFNQKLDIQVLNYFKLKSKKPANLKPWKKITKITLNTKRHVNIAIIGKYVELKDAYKSCLLYTSPSPRDAHESRMPSSA